MNKEHMELENEEEITNVNPLATLQSIKGFLTTEEELAFMQILFSSSATIRSGNFGLSRKEVEKIIGITDDDQAFFLFSSE